MGGRQEFSSHFWNILQWCILSNEMSGKCLSGPGDIVYSNDSQTSLSLSSGTNHGGFHETGQGPPQHVFWGRWKRFIGDTFMMNSG